MDDLCRKELIMQASLYVPVSVPVASDSRLLGQMESVVIPVPFQAFLPLPSSSSSSIRY